MARVLIVYSTREGQTAKIAHEMSGSLSAQGHQVEAHRVQDLPASETLADFDVVIAGSSMHLGALDKRLANWVKENLASLENMSSAFFSVSLTAAGTREKAQAELHRIIDTYLARTGWKPDVIAYFAGALAYSQYSLIKRLLMKQIARKEGGGTDSHRDYEYTDWASVRQFADQAVKSGESSRKVVSFIT